jgi:hypothetical protein
MAHFQTSYESIVELFQLKEGRVALKREASLNELKQVYHAPEHYLFFCIHDKHVFSACRRCERTQTDGDIARDVFIRRFAK